MGTGALLLQDISAAITNIGLTIESADLNTPNKEFADNTFVVKAPRKLAAGNPSLCPFQKPRTLDR